MRDDVELVDVAVEEPVGFWGILETAGLEGVGLEVSYLICVVGDETVRGEIRKKVDGGRRKSRGTRTLFETVKHDCSRFDPRLQYRQRVVFWTGIVAAEQGGQPEITGKRRKGRKTNR
jgi:hypothetical protein